MFPFYYYPLTAAEKTWRISIFLCRVYLAKLHSCCLPTKPWASRICLHHPGNLQEEETENRNLKTAPHPHLWQNEVSEKSCAVPALRGCRCLLALSLQSTSMLSLRCNKLSHWKILFLSPWEVGYLETVFWNTYIDNQLHSSVSVVTSPLSGGFPVLTVICSMLLHFPWAVSPSRGFSATYCPREKWCTLNLEAGRKGESRRWGGWLPPKVNYIGNHGSGNGHSTVCLFSTYIKLLLKCPSKDMPRLPWVCPSSVLYSGHKKNQITHSSGHGGILDLSI